MIFVYKYISIGQLHVASSLQQEKILKVLGKSVGLCKTTKRKDQLYISLLVSVENHLWKFQPKRTHISWDMNENINKENKKNSGFGEALQ